MKQGDVYMFKGVKLVASKYDHRTDEGPHADVCHKCALRNVSFFNTGIRCPNCDDQILVTPEEAVTRKLLQGKDRTK